MKTDYQTNFIVKMKRIFFERLDGSGSLRCS